MLSNDHALSPDSSSLRGRVLGVDHFTPIPVGAPDLSRLDYEWRG